VIDGAADDYEGALEVVVCDEDPGDEDRELLDDYMSEGSRGYRYGVVVASVGDPSHEYDTPVAVLWQGDPPEVTYRIDERDPGEDAFGRGILTIPLPRLTDLGGGS